tara:strand:+ start:66 stop:440 length:375 start_codon:yes stop_codon:yes gene_type:complete
MNQIAEKKSDSLIITEIIWNMAGKGLVSPIMYYEKIANILNLNDINNVKKIMIVKDNTNKMWLKHILTFVLYTNIYFMNYNKRNEVDMTEKQKKEEEQIMRKIKLGWSDFIEEFQEVYEKIRYT